MQELEGVVAYLDKNDIPGKNTFTPRNANFPANYYPPNYKEIIEEKVFCSGVIQYYYQPLGMVVATSQELAIRASELVKIEYLPGKEIPLFTNREVLKAGATSRILEEGGLKATRKG